jgi:putative tryptophan/tyrosine transport system substrate-binding protein
LIANIVERHGYDGLVLATLMAGAMMISVGFLRLGTYIKYTGKPARVGLFASDNPVMGPATDAFLDELRRAGFVEGQNLTVDRRSTAQDSTAFQVQAAEMVRTNSDVLVALGSEPVLQACMQASRTLPIVFVANNYDPIARGYVRSLAAPGGNATGVFLRQTELAEKQVELLTQAFPDRTRLAVFWDAISADQFAAASQRAILYRVPLIRTRVPIGANRWT